MAYVIYHIETTRFARIFRDGYWQDAQYKTEGAAKAGFNRLVRKGKISAPMYAITEKAHFHQHIEKWETKRNLCSGAEFKQRVNTPAVCDPSTETYWSA